MQAAFADSSYSQACFTFLPWCVGCPWLEYCTDLTFNVKPLLHQSHPSLCWRFLSFSILRARRGFYVGLINSTSTLLIATAPSLLIHIHPFIEPLWSNILSQNPLYYIIITLLLYFLLQVVHDCRNDSAALYFQYDILVKNVFDTQVTNNNLIFDDMHLATYGQNFWTMPG